jgi:hypothetical protein
VHNFLSAEINVDDSLLLIFEPNGCTVDTMYYRQLLWAMLQIKVLLFFLNFWWKVFIPSFFSDFPLPPAIFNTFRPKLHWNKSKNCFLTLQITESIKLPAANVNSTCIYFLWPFHHWQRPQNPLYMRLGGPHGQSGQVWNIILTGV